jgi:diguanylate cyclase (GGDEF)-like protein
VLFYALTIETTQKKRSSAAAHPDLKDYLDKQGHSEKQGEKELPFLAIPSNNPDFLPNKTYFNETLLKMISHVKRYNKILAVLLLEITPVNITTSCLSEITSKKISQQLIELLRTEDILAKFEGFQFGILLYDIEKAKFASTVASKILHAFSQPIKTDDGEISLNSTIGICVYPIEAASFEDLLNYAQVALGKAKNAGINTYRFYSQAMDAEAAEYLHLAKSLRKAIENHQLTLYYQPKLHLKTGTINRIEALVRWVHPEIGIIHPEKFLPVAEETGLIHPIGEWAIREACQINKHWQDEGYEHIPVAINLSPKQFYHRDIAATISSILQETGLSPNYLELEITETAVMGDTEKATRIFSEIKKTGVQISIDHFGAGYFSITQLKQFPLTLLKIDQSFIKGVPNNPNDCAITAAIIALAHNLGFEVVAEGVEAAEQVQFLASQGCDMVQGYFPGRPLPAEQMAAQFKKLAEGVLLYK